MKIKLITLSVSILVITGIPLIIFIASAYIYPKPKIDYLKCQCDCFDTIMRGPFIGKSYRSIFVNGTVNSYFIYTWFVVNILLWYEAIRYLTRFFFEQKFYFRLQFFILILINIYPNFYSWWHMFIYINNEMYDYIGHQILFTLGELTVTIIDFYFIDKTKSIFVDYIFIGGIINLSHLIIFMSDQSIFRGNFAQISRNIFLFFPDLIHLIVYLMTLKNTKNWFMSGKQWAILIGSFLSYLSIMWII